MKKLIIANLVFIGIIVVTQLIQLIISSNNSYIFEYTQSYIQIFIKRDANSHLPSITFIVSIVALIYAIKLLVKNNKT